MRKEMEKVYNPKDVEDKHYKNWLEKKYFHAVVDKDKKPYTIVIPPPNITGNLHMGHALDNTIQDILIRFKRMQGYSALWVPGCDHASISTEVKIVEKMAQEGLTKKDVGREEFLRRAWTWKEEYGGTITKQLKRLGSSLDWDRERFTLDEGLSKAVRKVFIDLYNKGLIYKGEKIINWCPKCLTTISDAEVNHEETGGKLYYVNYPLKDGGFLSVATTRPETMLGDTCLAVNPKDERYAALVGKTAFLPIVGRELPIVADDYVETDFGTGVVKITPAHDPNDFELSERHDIPKINVMNDNGTINENGGKFCGMSGKACREAIVKELEEAGLLTKIENITHAVGSHERCGVTVEPLIKMQWFVKMEQLAKPAIEVYKTGELNITPERYGKIYLNWLENIRDWCISRQLWWGHRIPAYYCSCGHVIVQEDAPESCPKCGGSDVVQDEDTLDTWFSSGLWPFSTLGWPEKTPEMEYFYPTSVLVTAYDIIFFWVIRMVFTALETTGTKPFSDVLIHGLIRDSQGRKFSKSLGNGVDPLEVIEKYGADALRLMLVSGSSPGNDMRFYIEKVEASRNFANKLWNASRFVMMNLDGFELTEMPRDELTSADKWILSKCNSLIPEVTQNLENYDFGLASQKVNDFLWEEYCDWYIEMVKPRLYNKDDKSRNAALYTLTHVLAKTLKLLHPFMPFITEEIYTALTGEETVMLAKWEEFDETLHFPNEEKEVDIIKSAVRAIRNIRSEMNVVPSKKIKACVITGDNWTLDVFTNGKVFFETLSGVSETVISSDKAVAGEKCVSAVIENATIYLPLDELIDMEKELLRLKKEKEKLEKEIERVESKLNNSGFVAKAPKAVVDEETAKKDKYSAMLEKIVEQIRSC